MPPSFHRFAKAGFFAGNVIISSVASFTEDSENTSPALPWLSSTSFMFAALYSGTKNVEMHAWIARQNEINKSLNDRLVLIKRDNAYLDDIELDVEVDFPSLFKIFNHITNNIIGFLAAICVYAGNFADFENANVMAGVSAMVFAVVHIMCSSRLRKYANDLQAEHGRLIEQAGTMLVRQQTLNGDLADQLHLTQEEQEALKNNNEAEIATLRARVEITDAQFAALQRQFMLTAEQLLITHREFAAKRAELNALTNDLQSAQQLAVARGQELERMYDQIDEIGALMDQVHEVLVHTTLPADNIDTNEIDNEGEVGNEAVFN